MHNQVTNFDSRSEATSKENSLLKFLVFEIGKLTLALPLEQVQKVIKHQPLYGSGLSHVNLTHLGNQEITIVDLHQKLFQSPQCDRSDDQGYFIITKGIIGEPLGIIVAKTPNLMDLPVNQIRTLPNSYRHADTLAIASHVAVVPQEQEKNLTIFILDLDRLI